MGEANFYYFTCLKILFPWLKLFEKIKNGRKDRQGSEADQEARLQGKGEESCASADSGRHKNRRQKTGQPSFREASKEFWNWSRSSTKAGPHQIRPLAQVCDPSAPEGRSSSASQGSSSNQSVFHDA